ncbi:hypothetical protein PF005_g14314 [Phytophthora fragariae]|uniref:RxLR effector protein n=2 Tax=Phytophthora TaxID=4783 RepID=A0A6A3XIF1_9STRA|nr:hypothetical protein PF003_g13294 [Phytophthora fragariae]KAE8979098.1 hypothetical protein PR002_g24510 [Phytophthora rubi]KAE8927170.1 hypothetical protein PF009_g22653 [Phytophthora fragariae]KAE8980879.1 hypothetical protein PR001_g24166 [Phytophthora rubi]KAE9006843.1 hypothetical protein PF011_g11390 [Phytophthora fragariae]
MTAMALVHAVTMAIFLACSFVLEDADGADPKNSPTSH